MCNLYFRIYATQQLCFDPFDIKCRDGSLGSSVCLTWNWKDKIQRLKFRMKVSEYIGVYLGSVSDVISQTYGKPA